jgi:hypothetical protein
VRHFEIWKFSNILNLLLLSSGHHVIQVLRERLFLLIFFLSIFAFVNVTINMALVRLKAKRG